MAQDASMRKVVGLIAQSLESFARLKRWCPEECWRFYLTKPELGRIHVLFVAVGFDDVEDDYATTQQVWDHLRTELAQHRDILQSVNLVVRSKKKVDEGGLYAIGSGYREYRPVATTRVK